MFSVLSDVVHVTVDLIIGVLYLCGLALAVGIVLIGMLVVFKILTNLETAVPKLVDWLTEGSE